MSLLAWIVIAIGLVVGGFAGGVKWHAGQDAIAAQDAQELRESDARQQRMLSDKAAGKHAEALASLSNQLGDAREKIARLPGRECLSADATSMLNATGNLASATPASEPASAPAAASSGSGLRYSTDRDVAGYIALCRTRYAEVADQLNKILDIEEKRWPQ